MPGFQFYFELIGAVAFAISGAALAVKKHMDLFGVAMMGMTTAVGGGILRDLLLGITPPAALRVPGRRGGMYAAVERRREPGAADRLRADGGAAALCRGIPLEPAESVNT